MDISAKAIPLNQPATAGSFQGVTDGLTVTEPSRVFLNLRPADISSYSREGADLIVVTGGESLRIVGFYQDKADSQLYLKDDEGNMLLADLSPAASGGAVFAQYTPQAEASPFESLTGAAAEDDDGLAGWALFGAGAVALAAGLSSGGGGGGGGDDAPPPATSVPDTTPPGTPTASFNADGSVISGTAEPGSTVGVDLNGDGTSDLTTVVGSDGNYSIPLTPPLANGETVNVVAIDPAGNVSPPASANAPDTTPPAIAQINGFNDDVGSVTGNLADGASTDDTMPTLTGRGDVGTTVRVYVDDTLLGTALVDSNGDWSFTPTAPLGAGVHHFEVTSVDAAGNESLESAPYSITIDTTAPTAPVVNPTNGTLLAGSGEPLSTIAIDVNGDGVADYSVAADAAGNWSVIPVPALGDGTAISVTATDAAGNTSSPTGVVVDADLVDSIAPSAPLISAIMDDVGSATGSVANGGSTDDNLPTLMGTAEAGSTVHIFLAGVLLDSVVADAVGAWSYTLTTPLANASYSFTATSQDAASNESVSSAPYVITVQHDLSAGGLSGSDAPILAIPEAGGGGINAAELANGIQAVVGLATGTQVGDVITITTNDGTSDLVTTHTVTQADLTNGIVVVTLTGTYADGHYTSSAVISDSAGNSSAPSSTLQFSVDATSPGGVTGTDAPTVAIAEAAGGINSAELADGIQAVVGLTPGTQVGDVITLTANDGTNDVVTSHTVTQADLTAGNVALTLAGTYADGNYSISAVISDAAGNSSAPSSPLLFSVDATSPGGVAGNDAPTVTIAEAGGGGINAAELADGIQAVVGLTPGTQAGDVITLTANDGTSDFVTSYTVTQADLTAGNVAVTLAGSYADGDYSISAVISDAAGNSSAPSSPLLFSVDATSPGGVTGSDAPTVAIAEALNGIDAAELADGIQAVVGLTPGTQVGDVITLTANDGTSNFVTTHTVIQADLTAGNVAVTLAGTYADGDYSIRAVISDAAGNSSAPSSPLLFTVDAFQPGGVTGTDAPTLAIAEAAGGINAGELADGIQTVVGLTPDTQAGDVITITVNDGTSDFITTHTVTLAELTAGSAAVTLAGTYADGDYTTSAV
ncbi:Ig-like domain-containing protein, partial [Pseudomonas sp. Leaf48]|uniref:Ig-like domain-containing protein n=1 Tax=Pseudomonas sp. Leaf48 TaxID=1736221 RepID=UPI003FA6CD67